MKTVHEWLRYDLERKAGLTPPHDLNWAKAQAARRRCVHFDRLRTNRLLLGAYRYESCGDNKAYRAIESAVARLQQYLTDPNRELLVDAANLIELEWCSPRVEWAYFEHTGRGDTKDPGGVAESTAPTRRKKPSCSTCAVDCDDRREPCAHWEPKQ